jgi:O-acetyl-ADP-ribose deacetylase (regulator of RNase III)
VRPLDRIRDYVVWGRMAEGGMGDVWLARHVGLNAPVVIKTLKLAHIETDGSLVKRLLDEASLEARIVSPYVVRVLDTGTHDGAPFLVKEYVDGLDLRQIARGRQLALERTMPLWYVCEVARQIANALEAAHRAGIIHRDVKPSNVISSSLEFKLTDFGLAIESMQGGREDVRGGTVRFMAPEALRGEAIDRRVDVFALGATAYQLRYGYSPFPTVGSTLSPAPPRFPAATSSAESAFQDMVARMLSKDADGRPADVAEPSKLFASLAGMLRPVLRCARTRAGYQLGDVLFTCEEGNIAAQTADAIVNSANCDMQMRFGVGAALVQVGGERIEREAADHGEQPLGACVATGAGRLHARYVLHAVCAWEHTSYVGRAMQATLLTAFSLGLRSLAVPALGTGAAGVPFEASALAIASVVRNLALLGGSPIARISFVLPDARKLQAFRQVLESVLYEDSIAPIDVGLPAPPAVVEDATVGADESWTRSGESAVCA